MTRKAFIATMPRCGSAWLANLFNERWDHVTAMHEPIRQSNLPWHGIEWPRHEGTHVVVGCDLALWPDVIPLDADLVIVDRSPLECLLSVQRTTMNHLSEALVRECQDGIRELKLSHPDALCVRFEDLFTEGTLCQIMTHLKAYPQSFRISHLLGVNVQAETSSSLYRAGMGFTEMLQQRLS